MQWAVRFPVGSDRSPHHAEQFLAAIRPLLAKRSVSLLLGNYAGTSGLFLRLPDDDGPFLVRQLLAAYPDCCVEPLALDRLTPPQPVVSTRLHLRPSVLPLAQQKDFEDTLRRELFDPLASLLAAVSGNQPDRHWAWLEIELSAADARRVRGARRFVERVLVARWWPEWLVAGLLSVSEGRGVSPALLRFVMQCYYIRRLPDVAPQRAAKQDATVHSAVTKLLTALFEVRVSVHTAAGGAATARTAAERVQAALQPLARFEHSTWQLRQRDARRQTPTMFLAPGEIATLWHPPTETVRNPGLDRLPYRQLEPPPKLPSTASHPQVAILGRVAFRERREAFGLLPEDRRRHLAIVGKTGMGKSTLLASLLVSDMRAGRGVGLIDPHGDLAELLLASVPRERTNDVVLLDAGDREYPVAFNPLTCWRPEQRALVASGVVSALKRQYADSWGPRLEHILRNAVLTLVEVQGASLASLLRLLTDGRYRRRIVAQVQDPIVRNFWEREFESWKPQYQIEAVAPIQNKVGQFLSHPALRAILGQANSTIDLRQIMDEGRIFIANLSKGKVGEDGSALLGSLLVTGLQLGAMSRADVQEHQRQDFHLAVDEFQNFATDSFATILSEARKYRLCLTLANQYLDQVPDATRAAVFGNVGSLLTFQVGATDAEALAEELGGEVTPADLVSLPKYTAYARLLVDGVAGRPFSMQTMPLAKPNARDRTTTIRRTSRHRYARPATAVERELAHAIGG